MILKEETRNIEEYIFAYCTQRFKSYKLYSSSSIIIYILPLGITFKFASNSKCILFSIIYFIGIIISFYRIENPLFVSYNDRVSFSFDIFHIDNF